MRIERLPDKTSTKSEFGEVTIGYSMSDNVLIATQTVSFAQSRILLDRYPDFRDFVNAYLRATRQRLRVMIATARKWRPGNVIRPNGLAYIAHRDIAAAGFQPHETYPVSFGADLTCGNFCVDRNGMPM
jgi:hypothetical protein